MPDPIPFRRPDIARQLDKARGLIVARPFDVHASLAFLYVLPNDFCAETRAAVDTAARLITEAGRGGSRIAVARYVLAQRLG